MKWLFLLALPLVASCAASPQAGALSDAAAYEAVIEGLFGDVEQLAERDLVAERNAVNNSRVYIDDPGIKRLTKHGPPLIPYLLAVMRIESLPQWAFVRAYTAAEQILQSVDPKAGIFWTGGLDGMMPSGRLRVIESIESNAVRLKIGTRLPSALSPVSGPSGKREPQG